MGEAGRDSRIAVVPGMKSRSRWHSFTCAVHGMVYTLRTQRNTWIELAAAAVVVVAGIWLHIEPLEWAVLGLTVCVILALEAVNSAIEAQRDFWLAETDLQTALTGTSPGAIAGATVSVGGGGGDAAAGH